jgi:hypothetical protein
MNTHDYIIIDMDVKYNNTNINIRRKRKFNEINEEYKMNEVKEEYVLNKENYNNNSFPLSDVEIEVESVSSDDNNEEDQLDAYTIRWSKYIQSFRDKYKKK